MKLSRRSFLGGSAVALVSVAAIGGRSQAATIPEAPTTDSPLMQPPVAPPSGQEYQPVVTLNGWTLPWRMNGEWKEFHLVAEPVVREIAPGMKANLWGYNGQTPGPTIEAVEGDMTQMRGEGGGQDALNFPGRTDNQLLALYGAIIGPERRMGTPVLERYKDLKPQADQLRQRYMAALKNDVAAFNAVAAKAGVSPIVVK